MLHPQQVDFVHGGVQKTKALGKPNVNHLSGVMAALNVVSWCMCVCVRVCVCVLLRDYLYILIYIYQYLNNFTKSIPATNK